MWLKSWMNSAEMAFKKVTPKTAKKVQSSQSILNHISRFNAPEQG